MAYIISIPSVVAYQSQPSSLLVGASIIGLTPVNVVNTPTPSFISYQAAGSILAVSGSFTANPQNSIIAIQAGGSVMQVRTDNASVVAVLSNSSVAVLQGTNPWVVNVPTPSYISYQLAGSLLAVSGSFSGGNSSVTLLGGGTVYQEKNATTASVLGIPILFKIDETNSVLSAVSPQSPFPIRGSVATLQGTNPWITVLTSGSIIATQIANSVMGVRTDSASVVAVLSNSSVATLQGTNPWQVNLVTPSLLSIQPGGSVMNVNVSGSVAARLFASSVSALQGTEPWIIGSIVGTQTEDSPAATADKGIFTLNVRNDTMSSVTSADGDYGALSVGPVGEGIVANAPITKWISTVTSVMSGVSVQAFAGPGTSIFTYITGIYVTNEASVASRVTITQGLGRVPASFLTVLIAPAGGGSNNVYSANPLRVLDNNGISASISAVASVYVTITGFTAKT